MAVTITEGIGTDVDTAVVSGDHRQRIVIASNSDASGVAPVDATDGLKVYTGTSQVTMDVAGSNIAAETGGNLATIATQITALNGKATAIDTGAVTISASALPSGASTAANQTTIIGHVDGIETLLGTIDADTSTLAGAVAGTEMQVDIVTSALPTGAATATNQTTIIGHVDGIESLLTTIDADTSKIPSQGQALAAASMPVVLPADQVTTLTPPAAITGFALESGGNLATIAGDTTSLDGKVTACNTGAVVISQNTDSIDGAGAPTVDSYTNVAISAAANTANQSLIAAPGASKQIWVYGINFTVGTGDGSASFQDEDDTAITGVMPFAQNSGMVISPAGNFAMPLWKVATNKALEVDTVTCDIKGSIQYAIISV